MVSKHLRGLLYDIMEKRHLKVTPLAAKLGIDAKTLRRLRSGKGKSVAIATIEALLTELDIGIEDLFAVVPDNVWYPIRRSGAVTVHFGSAPEADRGRDEEHFARLSVGTWDLKAFVHISQHLNATCDDGVVFDHVVHNDKLDPPGERLAFLERGNHIILGSPLVSPMAEDTVCHAWGLTPGDPHVAGKLPYRFRWGRAAASSLAEFAGTNPHGIVARGPTGLVARRTVIKKGDDGEDCGLICAYRYQPKTSDSGGRAGRRNGHGPAVGDDNVVIAIMGQSGCGTLAGARLLCRDDVAPELYPPKLGRPVMRAYRVRYRRRGVSPRLDDREIVEAALVPLER